MNVTYRTESDVSVHSVYGSDATVAEAAAMCVGKKVVTPEYTQRVIRRMLTSSPKELGPFEFASITYKIHTPIFVARHLVRYRTGRYIERSMRHCKAGYEVWDSGIDVSQLFVMYETLLAEGMRKEDARAILPLGTFTTFLLQLDLRNLMNLFSQRCNKKAQAETRAVAEKMREIAAFYFPLTMSTHMSV